MSNPFDLLGNDVEDINDVQVAPREVVKKNTSSKKADVPPPSANKDRARKNRPQPTGNEAALKDKNAGRTANKSKGVEEAKATKGKPSKGGKFDRHSRTGKTDSEKKVRQAGWTADAEGELEAEAEGAADAEDELKEESKVVKKSLEDYLKETEAANASSQRESRKVEAVAEADIIVKEQEEFIAQTKAKKEKSKALKTKQYLDFSASFADDAPAPRSDSAPRGGARGGRGAPKARGNARGGRAPRGPKAPKADGPKLTEENFPSLA